MAKTLAQVHKLTSIAEQLSKVTHFNTEEVKNAQKNKAFKLLPAWVPLWLFMIDYLTKYMRCLFFQCRSLVSIHQKMLSIGKIDRMRMREILHVIFDITDDVMLDLVYHAFDRDSDGYVSWFCGFHSAQSNWTNHKFMFSL